LQKEKSIDLEMPLSLMVRTDDMIE